ncbi:MAG: flagellar basal-body MS-ring/collar protein FliF [Pseudomonadota bacterium]
MSGKVQSLIATWEALSLSKRIWLVAATVATALAVAGVASLATRPSYALLYAGLDGQAAGEVVSALDGMNVAHEVRGQSIYVASPDRDRVRMELAKDGLPRQGQAGYELLDGLSSFGTTTQMFDAAYWRAKEGELARTILSTPGVKSARVHLANPGRTAFGRAGGEVKASVTVTTNAGSLSPRQALAVRYVVALAVEGLEPDNVAVIDSRGGVVLAPGENRPSAAMAGERGEREERMRRDLIEMLEARVGMGAVRVNLALELDMERETVAETIVDPESRIIISQDTSSIDESATGRAGTVSVASNLPGGDAASGDGSRSTRSEARETNNYDYSQTERRRDKIPGSISRISVAVLVDEIVETAEDGTIARRPRTPEELEQLRDLVASAVGYNDIRGDKITVESMPFAEGPKAGVEATANPIMSQLSANATTLLQLAVLSVVAIVLAFFVVRPVLSGGSPASAELDALSAEELAGAPQAALPATSNEEVTAPVEEERLDPVSLLRTVVSQREDETANLLRNWLEEAEEEGAA